MESQRIPDPCSTSIPVPWDFPEVSLCGIRRECSWVSFGCSALWADCVSQWQCPALALDTDLHSLLCVYTLCLLRCAHECHIRHMYRSEDSLWGLGLFCPVGFEPWTHIIELGCRHLYLMSHLIGHLHTFLNDFLILCALVLYLHVLSVWGYWIPWILSYWHLWVAILVLGIKPGSSWKAARVCNYWAISSVLQHNFKAISLIEYFLPCVLKICQCFWQQKS